MKLTIILLILPAPEGKLASRTGRRVTGWALTHSNSCCSGCVTLAWQAQAPGERDSEALGSEAEKLARLVSQYARAVELTEIEERLRRLEEASAGRA